LTKLVSDDAFSFFHRHRDTTRSRTHLSLDKDCPDACPTQPPNSGKVIAIPQVGGLHHRYERLAA
jgi:hypothetical protein